MIITITLNPAMDKTVVLEEFRIGEINRIISARTDLGGKGINVSKVLNEFDAPSIAMGFLGGVLEEIFLEELNDLGIKNKFISIMGETRTNIKIVDEMNHTYTDLNEKGPIVSKKERILFLQTYTDLLSEEDIVVLSGGLCRGVSKDFYGILTSIARNKGAYVIVDAEGEALEYAIKEKPNLIKPNEKEFAKLFGKDKLTEDVMIEKARGLIAYGIDKVLISRGKKGSIFITKDKIFISDALKVPVKSTVGAGDSMVSALIYSKIHGLSSKDTLAMAQAAGASAVMMEGTKACTMKDVKEKFNLAKKIIKEKTI